MNRMVSNLYTLDRFIRENDTENEVKKAIINCLVENINKEIAIDILSNDLQERLYDFIYDSEELDIDDGSNIKRAFTATIKDILAEYFSI
jgi:hypothetical protein